MRTFLLILCLLVLVPVMALFFISATPIVTLPSSLTALGQSTPITVSVSDPHGIRSAVATVEQNGSSYKVWDKEQPSHRLRWKGGVADAVYTFNAGVKTTPQLRDGKARLIVEATSNDFRGKTVSTEREVTVVTRSPSVSVDSDQHYLYLGMADLVTFNVSGYASESGVRVGDEKFRSWPMPGGKPGLFSLFAFAWNMPAGTPPLVYATDPAGNEVTGQMVYQFPKKDQPKYRVRDLQVDDKFIQKVVNELDPNGSGDPVERFVKINSEMRRANNKTLADLRLKTADHFLWSQQVHLGYDLSITQHVGVEATNDGRVVYAAPLGIYGNCIVVDHGYGLQSIYGHLSEIDVHEGDMVKRGQIMGKSGMTGMAGGDHIHFSMQLEGIQIDPKEWWDAHWIKDHIAKRVDLPGFNN
jgi:murein DD-endopeptidase MepM/ murein hydrolase activator NlpD